MNSDQNAGFQLNADLDVTDLARRFKAEGRIQIRDALHIDTAKYFQSILQTRTKWGLAWQIGAEGPQALRFAETEALSVTEKQSSMTRRAKRLATGDMDSSMTNMRC